MQSEDVESGDLPGSGNTCPGQATPVNTPSMTLNLDRKIATEDEGRAMAQIVHDLAPGASLAFATAFNGELSFAENIEKLASPVSEGGAGAKVVADDVSYFDEPFFQDGPVAVAVENAVAGGAAYFSAAGNNNLILGGNNVASWEAPASATPKAALPPSRRWGWGLTTAWTSTPKREPTTRSG